MKDEIRIESYGTVDELNSVIGVILTNPLSDKGRSILMDIQHQLFILGADLATPQNKKAKVERIGSKEITKLEQIIDELDEELSPLTTFILPGGSPAGAELHMARTVCRRAERRTVSLAKNEEISEDCVIYLNRLSDLLFVLARYENKKGDVKETPWISKK